MPKHVVPNPVTAKIRPTVSAICQELRSLQRMRCVSLKFRIMNENCLRATVAGTIGYRNDMPEKDRQKKFKEADDIIKQTRKSAVPLSPMHDIIVNSLLSIDAFDTHVDKLEKAMIELAKTLPVAEWVLQPEQRGFGVKSLAVIVGEAGDLGSYPNPAKLWRRMGCAPFQFDGKTLMGATWKSGKDGKLSSEGWTEYGYSPRRRSVMYVIGEGLIKQNGKINAGDDEDGDDASATDENRVGPYRARYDSAKATVAAKHPDYKPLRCHRHGMLLASKLLLKNLWIEWNK